MPGRLSRDPKYERIPHRLKSFFIERVQERRFIIAVQSIVHRRTGLAAAIFLGGTIFSAPVTFALCHYLSGIRAERGFNNLNLIPFIWQESCTVRRVSGIPSPRRMQ